MGTTSVAKWRERRAMGYQEVAWYPAISGILMKLEMMVNPIFVDRFYSIWNQFSKTWVSEPFEKTGPNYP
jgi:hypothetical protein